jgi:polysaccharide pyruvyl transferase WcaK-like protein
VPGDFWRDKDSIALEANLKFGFFDNSIKPGMDCDFADWVIFAGTPEWCSGRSYDLYQMILTHQLPVMIVGVGGGYEPYRPEFCEVISKAKIITVRETSTCEAVRAGGFDATYLPCPALLSATRDWERNINHVESVGLIYQATCDETVIWNGCSVSAYNYQKRLYHDIIDHYGAQTKIGLVCHYIDELSLAKRDFPNVELFYSFDAADYSRIYSKFDLVVGPRVHGIGAAASMGIPGIALSHDTRGLTCAGFLADIVPVDDDIARGIAAVEHLMTTIESRNHALLQHKSATMETYKTMIRHALKNPKVSYTQSLRHQPAKRYDLGDLADSGKLDNLYHLSCLDDHESTQHNPTIFSLYFWRKLLRAAKTALLPTVYSVRRILFPTKSRREKYLLPYLRRLLRPSGLGH